ncbi:MAG TPA: hypothetical protein VJ571_01515 [Candidatus Nitrosotalea sp.]|nr:hypothetical protein [Candidatus Nitrosotalea sp.]
MKFITLPRLKKLLNRLRISIIVVFIVLVTLTSLSLNSNAFADPLNDIQNDINSRLSANPHTGDRAILFVYSNTNWSGSMEDSAFSSATKDGQGNDEIVFACSGTSGIYSIVMQKQSEGGYLALAVIQNGKLLNSKATSAEYGVVSVAGNCEPDFSGNPILGFVAIILLIMLVVLLIKRYKNKKMPKDKPSGT